MTLTMAAAGALCFRYSPSDCQSVLLSVCPVSQFC